MRCTAIDGIRKYYIDTVAVWNDKKNKMTAKQQHGFCVRFGSWICLLGVMVV